MIEQLEKQLKERNKSGGSGIKLILKFGRSLRNIHLMLLTVVESTTHTGQS